MLITIFGESCTGKSSIANELKNKTNAEIYTGKDYLRLEKSEFEAKEKFKVLLENSILGDNIIYVIAEKEHLDLLPDKAFRVLVTANIDTIKERFAKRMRGNLPPPVAQMLDRNHGMFDKQAHDICLVSEEMDLEKACALILDSIKAH